jgi:hypothetical protein
MDHVVASAVAMALAPIPALHSVGRHCLPGIVSMAPVPIRAPHSVERHRFLDACQPELRLVRDAEPLSAQPAMARLQGLEPVHS